MITGRRLPGTIAHLAIDRPAMQRALIAGVAWGLPMGAWLMAIEFWRCGTFCLADAAFTTALCVAAGLPTVGLLAALMGRHRGGRTAAQLLSDLGRGT